MRGRRTEVLVHGIGVVGPGQEVVFESREFVLEGLDVCWVFVEEDLEYMLVYQSIANVDGKLG